MKRSIWSLMILVLTVFHYNELPAKRIIDSLAIVALYNATNGPNWTNKTNWLTNQPIDTIDTWSGVTVEKRRVDKIILNGNKLNRSLHPAISNLIYFLELVLDMRWNGTKHITNVITGGIPIINEV